MRIVSLLASGTELVCALGAGAELVGRSHECDDPSWVARLPCLSGPTFDVTGDSAAIDRRVRDKLAAGEPLYAVDRAALRALAPDVVVTQVHCDVCAVSPDQLGDAHAWPGLEGMRTVSMRAGSLGGVLRDVRVVGDAIGRGEEARVLERRLAAHAEDWRRATHDLARTRVVCLEWTDPPFAVGNWGPELVALAGGECLLGRPGEHSTANRWQDVVAADPDVLIVAPCGYSRARAEREMPALEERPGWRELRAVRSGRVFVCDGNRWFNRSGPRVFETIDLLAEMLHPEVFPAAHDGIAYRRW